MKNTEQSYLNILNRKKQYELVSKLNSFTTIKNIYPIKYDYYYLNISDGILYLNNYLNNFILSIDIIQYYQDYIMSCYDRNEIMIGHYNQYNQNISYAQIWNIRKSKNNITLECWKNEKKYKSIIREKLYLDDTTDYIDKLELMCLYLNSNTPTLLLPCEIYV